MHCRLYQLSLLWCLHITSSCVVVICITLVASSVLRIFHVVGEAALQVQLRDCHTNLRVICLLIICQHIQCAVDLLSSVDTQWFGEEQSCLVPVSGWVLRSSMEYMRSILAVEVGIEV